MTAAPLAVEKDPASLGFDPARLARIDTHFRRYVDDGRLAGWQAVVARDGHVVHSSEYGRRDDEADLPVEPDTRWRIYSMSKPITSVAAMILFERGELELTDPISTVAARLRRAPRLRQGLLDRAPDDPQPRADPGVAPAHPHRRADLRLPPRPRGRRALPGARLRVGRARRDGPGRLRRRLGLDAAVHVPGTEWNYSHATDVLGRLVEVVSGQSLDAFLADRDPRAPRHDRHRVRRATTRRAPRPSTPSARAAPGCGPTPWASPSCGPPPGSPAAAASSPPHRTTTGSPRCWRGGGELDGVRILGSRTVAYMGRNHLPGGADLEQVGRPLFAEMPFHGVGFGLGFSVVARPGGLPDPVQPRGDGLGRSREHGLLGRPGRARSPAMFFTQLLPSSAHPIRSQFRGLVYQALVD